MPVVLDASAMIAFLLNEPGADIVEELLLEEPPGCLAHAVNLCEVFYDFLRSKGDPAAISAVDSLQAAGLLVREDMDEAFWKKAGRFKVHFRMSLADAMAVALGERCGAEVVTSDRGDFEPVAQSGVCRVRFIR